MPPRPPALLPVLLLASAVLAACGPEPTDAHPEVAQAIERTREEHPEYWRRKVLLLGFDSCDPDLVEELVRRGRLPNFARLRREGAHGYLQSISPLLSPVVWTTIATGVEPERHGILDFVTDTPSGAVPVGARMRQADTMWELLARNGSDVGVVGWLVTYPAEPLNGFLVSDRVVQLAFEYGREADPDAPNLTWPEDLAEGIRRDRVTIDDLPLSRIRPFADVTEEEYSRAYSEKFTPENRLGNLRLTLAGAETVRNVGTRLYRERRPRFFACYFEAMDALSHLFMPYAPPRLPGIPEEDYLRYRDAIEANYVWHDRVLGEFMELCDPETTLLVVSDHGFKSGDFRRGDSSDFHAKTGAQWHRPYGSLFAWGHGVRRGHRVEGATVYDVAPTVLASMGYPVPREMRGRVLGEIFEDGLEAHRVPTYYGEARREQVVDWQIEEGAGERGLTPEEQDAFDRLNALGYLGGDRSDPVTTQLNRGNRLLQARRFDEALEIFRESAKSMAAEGREAPHVHVAIAEALFRKGDLEGAEAALDRAMLIDSRDVGARLLRTRLKLEREEFAAAEASARALRDERPDLPQTHLTVAAVHEALLERAKEAGDPAAATAARAAAIDAYAAALKLEPNQPPALFHIALLQIEHDLHLTASALEHVDRAIELRPEYHLALNARSVALLRLGVMARAGGDEAGARRHFEAAIESAERANEVVAKRARKDYPKAKANKAYALWQLGRLDEAAAEARLARAVDPDYRFGPDFSRALAEAGLSL